MLYDAYIYHGHYSVRIDVLRKDGLIKRKILHRLVQLRFLSINPKFDSSRYIYFSLTPMAIDWILSDSNFSTNWIKERE